MMKKRLIIGKNSVVVRRLKEMLDGSVDLISNVEIRHIDLEPYREIYLFSWSRHSFEENLCLIRQLPLERVYFVSTTAVYSLAWRRQWNSYPNWKLACENLVLRGGGRVIRLGICDDQVLGRFTGFAPVTDLSDLAKFVLEDLKNQERVINIYKLAVGGLLGRRAALVTRLNSFARRLPPWFLFQAPIELVIKRFLSSAYGYSADSARCFSHHVLVGFGVLGSEVFRNLSRDGISPLVVVSNYPDASLTANGFRGTRLGGNGTGLAKFWHGVSVDFDKCGQLKKNVPFVVQRPVLNGRELTGHVTSLGGTDGGLRLELSTDRIEKLSIDCRQIYLAAGAIENCIIVSRLSGENFFLSDHEIGSLGRLKTTEAIRLGMIKERSGFFLKGQVIVRSFRGHDFMLDARPFNPKIGLDSDNDLYNRTTLGVLSRLLRRFRFSELNEAFFNKFGVAIATDHMSLFVQIEVPNCINIRNSRIMSRKRLDENFIDEFKKFLGGMFQSFEPNAQVRLYDGQHPMGGEMLLRDEKIARLISTDQLKIVGSPTVKRLGPFHHTKKMIEELGLWKRS